MSRGESNQFKQQGKKGLEEAVEEAVSFQDFDWLRLLLF